MLDLVFALNGRSLPANHAATLWREVVGVLPWLAAEEHAGLVPLRMPEQGEGVWFLPRRAKLALRVPAGRGADARGLSGRTLNVDGHPVEIGPAHERPLQPASTLHAMLVVSRCGEADFLDEAEAELRQRGIAGQLICGRRAGLERGEERIAGYSLVVHDLKPQDSLRLQCLGLGGERHLGCGIFVPYKEIADLDG